LRPRNGILNNWNWAKSQLMGWSAADLQKV
jgi:hypothetical protein